MFVSAFYLYDDGGSFAAVLLLVAIVVFLIVLLVGMMKQYASDNQKFANEIGDLIRQIKKVHDGNMTDKPDSAGRFRSV